MYAVPALILFPGNPVAVSDRQQTEDFFAAAVGQYEGVDSADRHVTVMGEAPGSVWVDVTWRYGDRPVERFCYQLVDAAEGGEQIAVLTPMN
ncbi:MAG: hypothetical protein M3513_05845 [Actinomycetota bacterium]|nr:hypothetical protein [Actinomycetota bacterium]